MSTGYDFFCNQHQILSVTTHESQRGQQNLYINALGPSTHGHLYVPPTLSGVTAGHSLKDHGAHLAPPSVLTAGQSPEFLTVRVRPDPLGAPATVELVSRISGSEQITTALGAREKSKTSRERIDLPSPLTGGLDLGFRFVPGNYRPRTGEMLLSSFENANWAVAVEPRSASSA